MVRQIRGQDHTIAGAGADHDRIAGQVVAADIECRDRCGGRAASAPYQQRITRVRHCVGVPVAWVGGLIVAAAEP